ncbi:MAG TPA: sulfate ABC transporter permease subunit [Chloroflexota bacterium]|nr:sulfate ABC transporter permease subunit [Chloroflexota bacterium]
MPAKLLLRLIALGYLALLILVPTGTIVWRSLGSGIGAAWASITTPDSVHAIWLSVLLVLIAVPLNAVFGVLCALLLVRHDFPGRAILGALIDLPLSVSPVVVGLALILAYGQTGWFGAWLQAHGLQVIFALPGMALATMFVSLPFVAREVIPVLKEIGTDAEQAAQTLGASSFQTFRRITLPAIAAGLGYGIVLATARSLGEIGAVAVVSGRLVGQTETLTLVVQDRFENFDLTGAYTAALLLALMAVVTLLAMNALAPKERI